MAVRNSDLNLTLTREDINLLQKHYGYGKFDVLGVFEFKPFTELFYDATPRGHKYVITGWLGSKQTEESLIPWIREYYPLLKEEDPLEWNFQFVRIWHIAVLFIMSYIYSVSTSNCMF